VKKQQIIVILLLTSIIFSAIPLAFAANTLSKPNVTLPKNWTLNTDTPYPNAPAEHDNNGAGMVEYSDTNTYDFVMIYYENAPSTTYTSADLKAEAQSIFTRDHTNETMTESGVMTIGGVQAGYAKGYESDFNTYDLETVFIIGHYYFNAYAYYDATSQSDANVKALLNSITVGGSSNSMFGGSTLWIIIAAVAAIVVVIVIVLVLVTRKRKTPRRKRRKAFL